MNNKLFEASPTIIDPVVLFPESLEANELNPQAKSFRAFLDMIEKNQKDFKAKNQKTILERLRVKISPMKNLDDFKNLYISAILTQKYFYPMNFSVHSFLSRCRQRRAKEKKNDKWKTEKITLLVWAISEFAFVNKREPEFFQTTNDWQFLASLFPGITPEKCRYKWESMQKSKVQKEQWTSEEDKILTSLTNQYQGTYNYQKSFKWAAIARELNTKKIEGGCIRLGKHCRERWINTLNPELMKKKEWSAEEDLLLLELIAEKGRKWSMISKAVNGRNEHAVKNRYISILRQLRKEGVHLNPNNFEAVKNAYKKFNVSVGSPIKKQKKNNPSPPVTEAIKSSLKFEIKTKGNQCLRLEEISEEVSPSISPLNKINSLKNIRTLRESLPIISLNPSISCEAKPIFSVKSSFQIPNIYLKTYNSEEEPLFDVSFLETSDILEKLEILNRMESFDFIELRNKVELRNQMESLDLQNKMESMDLRNKTESFDFQKKMESFDLRNKMESMDSFDYRNKIDSIDYRNMLEPDLNKVDSFDLENISRNFSSMSVSDQLLVEANKILSEMPSRSISNRSGDVLISVSAVSSSDHSRIIITGREKPYVLLKAVEEKEKKGRVLVPKHDGNLDIHMWRGLMKCKTQQVKEEEDDGAPKRASKKKSQTMKDSLSIFHGDSDLKQ